MVQSLPSYGEFRGLPLTTGPGLEASGQRPRNQTYNFIRFSFTILIVQMKLTRYSSIQTRCGRLNVFWRTNPFSETWELRWA
jgi:hypothetical protein